MGEAVRKAIADRVLRPVYSAHPKPRLELHRSTARSQRMKIHQCGCVTEDGELAIPCLRHNHLDH